MTRASSLEMEDLSNAIQTNNLQQYAQPAVSPAPRKSRRHMAIKLQTPHLSASRCHNCRLYPLAGAGRWETQPARPVLASTCPPLLPMRSTKMCVVYGIDDTIQSRIGIDGRNEMSDHVHRDLAVKMMGLGLMSEA